MTNTKTQSNPNGGGRVKGKQFPHNWCTGPDPWLHDQYYLWLKHKSQANFRGEGYDFTWEDWQHFWFKDDNWQHRGRARDCLVLTRKDHEKAWSRRNCILMSRLELLRAKIRGQKGFPMPKPKTRRI